MAPRAAGDPPNPVPNFAKLSSEEEAYFKSEGGIAPERQPEPEPPPQEPRPPIEPVREPEEQPEPYTAEPPIEGEQPPLGEPLEPGTERPTAIPVHVVQAERERRQAAEQRARQLEQELNTHREYRARIDERLRVINEQNRMAQNIPPAEPNVEEDPLGHARWERDRLNERLASMEQRLEQAAQGNQANSLQQHVASITQAFAANTPDYFPAVRALRGELDADLIEGGYLDPGERNFMVNQWTDAIVRKSIQEGKNPSQAVYNIAKRRLSGRQLTAAQAAPAVTATTPTEKAVAGPSNRERVAGVRRGAAATTSLGRVGARDTSEGITLDKLLEASPEQFARYMAEQPQLVASLMGK